MRMITDYMAMVVVTPIFLFVAAGMTTAAQDSSAVVYLRDQLHLGGAIQFLLRAMPILALWAAFTFVYMAMPNARTRLRSAMLGAFFAACLWQIALLLHLKFQIGIARYNAIYASFAAFPIFLVWVNLSWVIVLVGAEIAFAHQSEPSYARLDQNELADHSYKERLGLRAMTRIAQRFLRGEPAWMASDLAQELSAPQRVLEEVLYACVDQCLLVDAYDGDMRTCLPARDLVAISVMSISGALRGSQGKVPPPDRAVTSEDEQIDRVLSGIDRELEASRHNRTLRNLAESLARESAVRPQAEDERARAGDGSPARA
jgi:membrane protein